MLSLYLDRLGTLSGVEASKHDYAHAHEHDSYAMAKVILYLEAALALLCTSFSSHPSWAQAQRREKKHQISIRRLGSQDLRSGINGLLWMVHVQTGTRKKTPFLGTSVGLYSDRTYICREIFYEATPQTEEGLQD